MKRRHFRSVGNIKSYRPVFIIATEGKKTEPDYFRMGIFRSRERPVRVKVLGSGSGSSPQAVLNRMRKHLRSYQRKEGDEAWLVVDKDQWEVKDLEVLYAWSQFDAYKNLAVSNPQFEYWLLLHFEDGNKINNKDECLSRLKRYIFDYDKSNIPIDKFTVTRVKGAIKRAKSKDSPPCTKWPIKTGTTVYRIVEKILK
jgi:hypothetical protein